MMRLGFLCCIYKLGRKLVEDRTAKSRLLGVQVSESQFADDLALYAVNHAAFKSAGRNSFKWEVFLV